MIECTKILFSISPQLRETLHIDELESTLAIEAYFLDIDEVMAIEGGVPKFGMAVLECEDDFYNELICGVEVLIQSDEMPFSRFILVSKKPLNSDLSQAWQLGMHCHVCIADDVDNVYHSIESYCRLTNQTFRLEQQLKEASDIAVLSMSASSQLGEIIRFLEKSYQCKNYEALGTLLQETLELMGVTGCGLIQTNDTPIYFGEQAREVIWRRLLQEYKDKGRFIDIENRTITNFDNISVMARNLPAPGSDDHGRMKDTLFTLIEGAEARVKSIAVEQQAQIAEKAKASFLGLMSHELRTPMNSILGFSNRLIRKQEGDCFKPRDIEALEQVHQSGQRLMGMINDLLELSNLGTNIDEEKQRHLLQDVLHEPLRIAAEKAEEKQLVFESIQHDPTLSADIDRRRLQQIVNRLLDNAVKFTTKGKVSVTVESVYDHNQGDRLKMTISDTGCGFSEEQRKSIFRPFEIGEDLLTRKQDGIGIGLVLVHGFVRELSATLEMTSEYEVGTTFTLLIPQYDHQPPEDIELF